MIKSRGPLSAVEERGKTFLASEEKGKLDFLRTSGGQEEEKSFIPPFKEQLRAIKGDMMGERSNASANYLARVFGDLENADKSCLPFPVLTRHSNRVFGLTSAVNKRGEDKLMPIN